MEVGDENVVDPAHLEFEFPQLNLCPLSTVDQEQLLIQLDDLRGRKPLRGWQR